MTKYLQDRGARTSERNAINNAISGEGPGPGRKAVKRGIGVKALRHSIAQGIKSRSYRNSARSHSNDVSDASNAFTLGTNGSISELASTYIVKPQPDDDDLDREEYTVRNKAREKTSIADIEEVETAERTSIKENADPEAAEQSSSEDTVEPQSDAQTSIEEGPLVETTPTDLALHRTRMQNIPQLVTWKCSCGTRLCDYYTEIVPGSLEQLQTHLRRENARSCGMWQAFWTSLLSFIGWRPASRFSGSADPTNDLLAPQIASTSTEDPHSTNNYINSANARGSPPVKATAPSSSIGIIEPLQVLEADPTVSYILLCFPEGLSGLRLHHQQILQTIGRNALPNQITNDRQLFTLLRKKYALERRRFMSKFWPKTVVRVSLAYFLVDLSDYVELKHYACRDGRTDCRCIPPPEMIRPSSGAQYYCTPREPRLKPPIGTNYLTHYFQNPGCIKSTNLVYTLNQVPKRLGQCMATSGSQRVEAWGLEFEEGWDRGRLRNAIFGIVVSGCIIFALLWSVLLKDMQSAFALASFFVTVLAVVGAYIASAEPRIVHK